MPRFMDFHEDLKLPDEHIAQIADDARHEPQAGTRVRLTGVYGRPHRAHGRNRDVTAGPVW